MYAKLPAFTRLIRHLQRMPYLASKNVSKVALYLLTSEQATIDQLLQAIAHAREALKLCGVCANWTEGQDLCSICANTARRHRVICVVEQWHDLWAIENAGGYDGVYHVLGGSLCPLEGVGPQHLRIKQLIDRVQQGVQELIFATNPTPEGEATASYICAKIAPGSVQISKVASGIPTGSSLEYMDRLTISKALAGRRPF